MVVAGSTPSLQYPTSESLASGSQEALVEVEPAASSAGSSTESIRSLLLCAAQEYLSTLGDKLQFQALVGLERLLSPPSSCAPSLQFILEHPDHTTGSTSVTGSLSTPAPSSLHQPNWLIGNRVDITVTIYFSFSLAPALPHLSSPHHRQIHLVTSSPRHLVTSSPHHHVTLSPHHHVTSSPHHPST